MDVQSFRRGISRDPAAVLNLFINTVQLGKMIKNFLYHFTKNDVKVPVRTHATIQQQSPTGGPLAVLKRHIFHLQPPQPSSAPQSTELFASSSCYLSLLVLIVPNSFRRWRPPHSQPKLSNLFLFSDLFPSSSPAPEPASSCRHSEQRHSTPAHIKDTLLAHECACACLCECVCAWSSSYSGATRGGRLQYTTDSCACFCPQREREREIEKKM